MIHCQKTVYAPPAPDDGWRIIVMHTHPRGVPKAARHAWLPELAPSGHLVKFYHAQRGEIERKWAKSDPDRCRRELGKFWRKYSRKYVSEMKAHKQLIAFLGQMSTERPITLMCTCKEPEFCHRSLLAGLIGEAARTQ